jgi:phospholipid/cholesterol/gamma-HCH transport system substrate-binding protein
MEQRTTEIKVGIAVILAVIILAAAVVWIQGIRFSRKWETYSVLFDEVGGLSVGDPVAVSGLELGKVGSIKLDGGRVMTELQLQEGVVLRSDCSVEIRSIGLMGEKYVYIMPGTTGEVLAPGSVIEGQFKAGLPEIVAEMGDVMGEARAAIKAINRLLAAGEHEYRISESLSKLNQAADEIMRILGENRDDIRSTAKSMKTLSADLSEVVDSRKDELITGIDKFSAAADQLDSVTTTLQGIVGRVERGEGSLGMLIKEERLYQDMERAVRSLNELIADIKEHPERYIKIEIF